MENHDVKQICDLIELFLTFLNLNFKIFIYRYYVTWYNGILCYYGIYNLFLNTTVRKYYSKNVFEVDGFYFILIQLIVGLRINSCEDYLLLYSTL